MIKSLIRKFNTMYWLLHSVKAGLVKYRYTHGRLTIEGTGYGKVRKYCMGGATNWSLRTVAS